MLASLSKMKEELRRYTGIIEAVGRILEVTKRDEAHPYFRVLTATDLPDDLDSDSKVVDYVRRLYSCFNCMGFDDDKKMLFVDVFEVFYCYPCEAYEFIKAYKLSGLDGLAATEIGFIQKINGLKLRIVEFIETESAHLLETANNLFYQQQVRRDEIKYFNDTCEVINELLLQVNGRLPPYYLIVLKTVCTLPVFETNEQVIGYMAEMSDVVRKQVIGDGSMTPTKTKRLNFFNLLFTFPLVAHELMTACQQHRLDYLHSDKRIEFLIVIGAQYQQRIANLHLELEELSDRAKKVEKMYGLLNGVT